MLNHLTAHWWVTTCTEDHSPEKLMWVSGSQDFIRVSLCRHDHWIIAHVINLNLQLFLPFQEVRLDNAVQSPNPLITWLIFLEWPAPILSHTLTNNQGAIRSDLVSINYQELPLTKTILSRKNFREFQGLPSKHERQNPAKIFNCTIIYKALYLVPRIHIAVVIIVVNNVHRTLIWKGKLKNRSMIYLLASGTTENLIFSKILLAH